jgi:hypothetical protein
MRVLDQIEEQHDNPEGHAGVGRLTQHEVEENVEELRKLVRMLPEEARMIVVQ